MTERKATIIKLQVDYDTADRTGHDVVSVYKGTVQTAIDLLKEQEEPIVPELEGGCSQWWYVCGECNGTIDKPDKYCRHCGRLVKW